MLTIDNVEIDTVEMNEIEDILEKEETLDLEDSEDPFEQQANEWLDRCKCSDKADGVWFGDGSRRENCGRW
jgi:hypothetical protein